MEINVNKEKNGKVEIVVSASAQDIMHGKEHALNMFAPHVEVTGFRKGKAPLQMVEKNVKEEKLVEETIGHVAQDAYREAMANHKLSPITEPSVTMNELKDADGGIPAEVFWPKIQKEGTTLTITTFERPVVELGDWEKAAKKAQKPEDVKKEVEEKAPVIETATSIEDAKSKAANSDEKDATPVAPEVDPKVVQEREQREYDERIIDQLIDEAKVEIAHDLVMGEAQQMMMQQVQIVQQLGIDYKDFLKNQGKTIEDVEKESEETAERSIKGRFVLGELAQQFEKDLPESPTYVQVLSFIKDQIAKK
ncbi:hypothetical protein GW793_00165 [bacterium]|uniref:Uncharacterized protein n=2 Tax=Katanobacteria TaxID=422282 RepID=A0A2M7X4A2_UNCKA|nr:hypothetical protein [bacterium]PIP56765.1 MAG: hypothetical protein COX05_01315 [candidate division WWE3 bacterium CG22_combo_CG10-13_8_21_14_all_39_12]PJA40993.1 MAG: hypothetical protein CO179_00880 [candidate division WWE3 bacterium CG_4_9_14_3_um_filter_39_7]